MKRLAAMSAIAAALLPCVGAERATISSGAATISFSEDGGVYRPTVTVSGKRIGGDALGVNWVYIDFDGEKIPGVYTKLVDKGGVVGLKAVVEAKGGVKFEVVDAFSSDGGGDFRVRRRVRVSRPDGGTDGGYYTGFAVDTGDRFAKVDPFVPSAMYKGMFDERVNPKKWGLRPDRHSFFFREDRLSLPVAMYRRPDGIAVSVTLEDTGDRTVLADCKGERPDEGYRFGGVGFGRLDDDSFACHVTYPGSDRRGGGMGERRHPARDGMADSYSFRLRFEKTASYGAAVESVWNRAVDIYDPPVILTHSASARKGLLDTLYSYRQSPDGDQDLIKTKPDKPGFPWCVELEKEFKVWDWTYEIGFVGAQTVAAYCLLQAGVFEGNAGWRKHGEAVIDFWARESLSELGFPNSRYYPLNKCWDGGNTCTLRQASTGFCGVMDAWSFLKKRGEDRPEWIAACRRLGDWLVANQDGDGSWPMEVNPRKVVDGKHPVVRANKALTICGVTYLSRLFAATKDAKYKAAALKAAEFAWKWQHVDYLYAACVIDNPEMIDSESGYEAMKGFLSVYEIDRKPKWLAAAKQAAVYTETWVYLHEVPPEDDAKGGTDWPFDRSVIGQHMLTVDQPGADLGFAWTAYWYHWLWKHTKDRRFLRMARISMHNVKQSMNLGGLLYPGRGEGLQCEVCTLRTTGGPRRHWAMKQALTWNFAAHLQQYALFIDDGEGACPADMLTAETPPYGKTPVRAGNKNKKGEGK